MIPAFAREPAARAVLVDERADLLLEHLLRIRPQRRLIRADGRASHQQSKREYGQFHFEDYPNITIACLHLAQGVRAAGETVCLNAELVEHGEVEIGGGQFAKVHLTAPTRVGVDTGSRLVFLVTPTVLEVLAVLEAQLAAADQ